MGASASGLQAPHQVRHRDQEDHQGDGDDRRLAHRQGAAQGGGVDAVRDRAHPRGDRGGDRLQHQAPADHRGRERRPAPRSCSSRATAVWPAATPPTPSRRRSGCTERLRGEGKEVDTYIVGRKGVAYYGFRERKVADSWTGFTDNPTYADAKRVAGPLIEAVQQETAEGGVDELHIVFTEFVSMMTQNAGRRPDAAALPRRGRGGRGRPARARSFRCSTSSRRPRTSSTPCCRATSRAVSTTHCCRLPLPSTPPAAAR